MGIKGSVVICCSTNKTATVIQNVEFRRPVKPTHILNINLNISSKPVHCLFSEAFCTDSPCFSNAVPIFGSKALLAFLSTRAKLSGQWRPNMWIETQPRALSGSPAVLLRLRQAVLANAKSYRTPLLVETTSGAEE